MFKEFVWKSFRAEYAHIFFTLATFPEILRFYVDVVCVNLFVTLLENQ